MPIEGKIKPFDSESRELKSYSDREDIIRSQIIELRSRLTHRTQMSGDERFGLHQQIDALNAKLVEMGAEPEVPPDKNNS
jgi:hypothetical protein